MITVQCVCGKTVEVPETQCNGSQGCAACGATVSWACAEDLPEGAGAGDFDGRLSFKSGPFAGRVLLLGGVAPIGIGKKEGNHVLLQGNMISRQHCQLERVDFGPSRWKLVDNGSTNGSFVNGERVTEHELKAGDVLRIGEHELEFGYPAAVVALPPPPPAPTGGPGCPCCAKSLAPNAKICVECGVQVPSGRPVLMRQGMDEDAIYIRAEGWLMFVSWIVWLTPLPMPIASEAYGNRKPWTIWGIAALTVLVSLVFFIQVIKSGDEAVPTMAHMMLWPDKQKSREETAVTRKEVEGFLKELDDDDRTDVDLKMRELRGKVPDDKLEYIAAEAVLKEYIAIARDVPDFAWYQLLTHALLHDPNGILGFVLHLGGNLLFMLVFGSRVNSLIGNIATAILYPILAAGAALLYLYTSNSGIPMLGASGAINGLAGMYLVLFPIHRVYCAMWIRIRLWWAFKIFTLRGFWVLLIYIAYDTLMVYLGASTGTAHWAHIGGFLTGMALGFLILFSRLIYCGGADLLSVCLGKYAWSLIGKPRSQVLA